MANKTQGLCAIGLVLSITLTGASAMAEDPPAKAIKYHSVLRKRPQPGYLFDRFYNAWLDEASADHLAEFLSQQTTAPGDSADKLLLAFFYAKQGDDLRAIEQFRATLANDPGNAGAWFQKAVVEARTLDFETALSDLQQAGEAKPNDKLAVRIAKLQGQLLVRNRQRDKAIKIWEDLLNDRPADEELAEDLIELEISEGLYEEATAASETLLERTKDPYLKVVRRLRLGDIQQLAGNRDEALKTYRSTLEQVGLGSWLEREILAQIEQVFRREDDINGLKKEYSQLLEAFPKRIGLRRNFAGILAELGENEAAVKQFEEILRRVPGERNYRESFISLLTKADKLDDATKQLEALVEQHPDDSELYIRLAQLYHKAEQSDQAAQVVQKFIDSSDKSEYTYLRAARLLEQFEMFDQAKQSYQQLVESAPESIAAKESQAAFLYRREEKDAAKKIWRTLAQTDDVNQVVRVAKTAIARQENELAFELLEKEHDQFAKNPLFLAQLVNVALTLKKFDQAIPWAEQRVELAESSNELENAILQAAKVIERAEQEVQVIQRMQQLQQPSVPQACLLAELLENSGDSQQADAVLAELGERGGLLGISQQIRLASARRDWQRAAQATSELLKLPGGRKSQYVRRLVEFYQRDFRIKDALRWIAEWKKLAPGNISPWLTEAKLLRLDGKEDDAIAALRAAAREFEDSSEVRIRLAQLYSEAGKLGDAERIYWQQYETSENLGEKLRWAEQLARIAEQQGKVSQLLENFNERKRTNRTSIVPLLALAQIHRVTNNYEGRRQALTAATKIKPDDLQLLLQIARIEEQEGDWERALETLERAIPFDKTNRTKQKIARLHIEYGNSEDGFALLYEIAGGQQSDPRDIEAIADAMCSTDEWEKAEEFLLEHINEHPQDYRLQYLLATTQAEQDETTASMESFAKVLDAEQELPGTKPTNTNNLHAYWAMMAPIVPPETMEMIQLSQLKSTILRHRQSGRGVVLSVSGTGGATSISMPRDVEEARRYALVNLLYASQYLDDDERTDLISLLKRHGVAEGELLITACGGETRQNVEPNVLLEKFPDNQAALAYALVISGWGQSNLDAELAANAYKVFAESRPSLAIMAALAAGTRDEEHHDLLAEASRMMEDIEQPNMMLVMSLCAQLGGMPGRSQSTLPEEYRERLSDQLLTWYPTLKGNNPYGPWAFRYVVNALRGNDTPNDYLAFLDDEAARWRMRPNRRSNQQNNPFGSRQNQFLQVPTWPPTMLADFSGMLLQTIGAGGQQFDPFGEQIVINWEDDAYRNSLNQVKDPILKILLLAQIDESDDEIEQILDKLIAAETPTLDALLVSAAWQAEAGRHRAASQSLQKARYLPMTRDVRRLVDSSLVALATEYQSENTGGEDSEVEPKDEVIEAGKLAALRLRHNRLQSDQRIQLIAALEELGLSKEADKLDKEQSLAANASSRGVSRSVYIGSSRQPKDRIQKLLDSGKRETAAKALSNELMGLVRQAASMGVNAYHYQYQFDQFREKVANYSITDEVLNTLDPGESKNFRKIGDFALANEVLGRKANAIDNYRRALELRENQDAYRAKLIFLLAPDDMDAAAELFEGFGKQGVTLIASEIAARMQHHNKPIGDRLDAMAVAVRYVEEQSDAGATDLSWIENLCQLLAQQMHQNSGYVPPLYQPKSASNSGRRGVSQDVIARRDAMHDRLCREMLKHESLAAQGFTHLLAAATAKEEVGDEFVDLAADALMVKPPEKSKSNQHNPIRQMIHYSRNAQNVPMRSPAEYLVRHSYRTKDWTLLDETVLPAMDHPEQKQQVEQIERLRHLYECPVDEFFEVAKSHTRKANRSRAQMPTHSGQDAVSLVIDAWSDREIDVDLLPILEDAATKAVKTPNYYQAPGFFVRYTEALGRKKQLGILEEWLEVLAELHVGPKSKRADMIKKHYSRRNIQWNTPNGLMYVYGQLLEQLLRHPDLVLPTMRFIYEAEVSGIAQNTQHYGYQGLQTLFERDAAEIVAALRGTHLVNDVDNFDPYAQSSGSNSTSGISLVGSRISQLKEAKRRELVKLIEQSGEENFGIQLLSALSSDAEAQNKLLESIGDRIEQLQTLDEEQQAKVAAGMQAITHAMTRRKSYTKMSPQMQRALDWINGKRAEGAKSMIEQALKAKRLEDLKIEYHNADEWLSKHLQPLAEHSPEKAAEVFFRIVDLVEDSQRRSQNYYYYGDESLAGGLLGRMFNYSGRQRSLDAPRLGLEVLLHERGEEVQLPRWGVSRFTESIRNAYIQSRPKRTKEAKVDRKQETATQVERWIEALAESFGDRPSTIYAPAYMNVFQQIDKNSRQDVLSLIRDKSEGDEHPDLAKELLAAAELLYAEESSNKKSDGRADTAPYHQHYLTAINDESKPLTWRLAIAQTLYDKQGQRLPQEVVEATANAVMLALRGKTPIDSNQQRSLVRNLLDLSESDAELPETLLNDFAADWAKRYLSSKSSQSRSRPGVNLYRMNDQTMVTLMLKMYFQLGDESAVNKLLRIYENSLSYRPDAIGLLVRAGKTDRAAQLVRRGWQNCNFSAVSSGLAFYDTATQEKLPELYERIKDDDLRYFTKGLMICLSDPKPKPEKDFVERKERQAKFAERFSDVKFRSNDMKKRTLLLLASRGTVPQPVADSLQEEAEKSDLRRAAQANQNSFHKSEAIVMAYVRYALGQGNTQPAVDVLSRLLEADEIDNWQINNAINSISREVFGKLRDKNIEWTPEAYAALLPPTKKMVTATENRYLHQRDQAHAITLVAHVLGNQTDEFLKWTKEWNEDQRKEIGRYSVNDSCFEILARSQGKPTGDNLTARLELAQNVIKLLDAAGWLNFSSNLDTQVRNKDLFGQFVRHKLLTKQELLEHGPEIADTDSADGKIWASLALMQQNAKKWQAASASWRQVANLRPADEIEQRQRAHINAVEALRRGGEFEAASDALAELDSQKVHAKLKEPLAKLRKQLTEALNSEVPDDTASDDGPDNPKAAKTSRETDSNSDQVNKKKQPTTDDQALALPPQPFIIKFADHLPTPVGVSSHVEA